MWLYASRDYRLLNENLDDRFIAHLTRQYIATSVLYFLALVLSLWNGIAGLGAVCGIDVAIPAATEKASVPKLRG